MLFWVARLGLDFAEAWRLHLFPRLKGALAELKATMRGELGVKPVAPRVAASLCFLETPTTTTTTISSVHPSPGYFCLYHEATLVNLLSICLHHAHVTEALGESATLAHHVEAPTAADRR